MQNNKLKKLIAIPGNSKYNKDWIDEVALGFKEIFEETKSHHYKHWENKDAEIDFEHEVNSVSGKVTEWNEFTVFAKSAGTLVTLMSIKSGKIKPKNVVFVGFPMSFAKSKGIDLNELIRDIKIPMIFIQKKNDPAATAEEVEEFLKDKGLNYKVVGIDGDDHHYEDIELIKKIFLKMSEELEGKDN